MLLQLLLLLLLGLATPAYSCDTFALGTVFSYFKNRNSGLYLRPETDTTGARVVQDTLDTSNDSFKWEVAQGPLPQLTKLVNQASGLYLLADSALEGAFVSIGAANDSGDILCLSMRAATPYHYINYDSVNIAVESQSTTSGAYANVYAQNDANLAMYGELIDPTTTWSGHKYDFHGECDLVLAKNPEFANGRGLSIHIRTRIKSIMSYIERVAIQIGTDALELTNSKHEWRLNGESFQKDPMLDEFEVWRFPKAISIRLDPTTKSKIDFFTRHGGLPYLRLDGAHTDIFNGTVGMLGDWKTGKMTARDGMTLIEDPVAFAREWQVRPELDGALFHTTRAPQYPNQCRLPKHSFTSRLGDSRMRASAEKACAAWKEDKDDCIMDVMVMRDLRAASHPIAGQ